MIRNTSSGSATTSGLEAIPLMQMISERIIVRASNPGQFDNIDLITETNGASGPWCEDPSSGAIYHIGELKATK